MSGNEVAPPAAAFRPTTSRAASAATCRRRSSLTLGRAGGVRRRSRPGVAKDYTASTTATVISTAGDATLSVADPSTTNTGKLVNGTFALPQTLQANGGGAFAPVGGSASPTALKTWSAPTSNEVGRDHVQAVDRRQRRAAHRHLQQDPDVHAVDHDAVNRARLTRGPSREPPGS